MYIFMNLENLVSFHHDTLADEFINPHKLFTIQCIQFVGGSYTQKAVKVRTPWRVYRTVPTLKFFQTLV